jgi:pimeloyl-ACP methyl ester carboxylesterase
MCLLLILFTSAGQQALADSEDSSWFCESRGDDSYIRWIDTDLGEQKVVVVLPQNSSSNVDLVVFLHADSPFRNPVYQYDIAKEIVQSRPGTVAATVLRPGYADSCNDRSAGDAGRKMGDNYTAEVIDSIASTIRQIRHELSPRRTIVIGHSGGAAIAALLASRFVELQEQSILVACPCDLSTWRSSMAKLTQNSSWLELMPGLSPIDEIERIDPTKQIHLWVGDEDVVTPPILSLEYSAKANQSGKTVSHYVLPGGDHDMILRPEILRKIVQNIDDRPEAK